MAAPVREVPPYAQRDEGRPKGEELHVGVVFVAIVFGLLDIERRPAHVVALGVQNGDGDVVKGVPAVLLVQRIRRRGVAALVHAFRRGAVPGEVLLRGPVQSAQVPRALLVGGRSDEGVVVVVEEDGVAAVVGDGPVEGVGQFAVKGGESVALGVAARGEVAGFRGVGAAGADAGADVAAVAVVHVEDEACW